MKYLLDTNVVSELIKKDPNPSVMRWLGTCEEKSMFLSVITIGELHKGISKLADPHRVNKLKNWVSNDLVRRFDDRISPINLNVTTTWGQLQGHSELNGIKLPLVDSLIAATAIEFRLVVAARNLIDLERCRVPVYNPWNYS